jgi:hypothetical protein
MFAYALMRHAADLEKEWITSPYYDKLLVAQANTLRRSLCIVDVTLYRGIERDPFSEWAAYPEGDPEPEARALLLDALGPSGEDSETPYPRAFVRTLQKALQIRQALRFPDIYEIVELSSFDEKPSKLMGFDVGYWGGGDFSIICDASIWPKWHPPDPEALKQLARFVERLNDALLFGSERDAKDYLTWYSTQDWAEKPPTDFSVIGVGTVNVPIQ